MEPVAPTLAQVGIDKKLSMRARARLRQWQASRTWIPNLHNQPLHALEVLGMDGDDTRREAAKATGNWSLIGAIDALREHARKRSRR